MTTAFDPIAEVAAEAAVNALPEHVSLGSITPLPRGADAFVGTPRPLLLACTRWLHAAPGGVMIGGAPAAVAAALGFDVPAKPEPVAAEDRDPDAPPPPRWSELVVAAATANLTTVSQAIASAVADLGDIPPACAATQVSMNDSDAAIRAETGTIPDAVVLMLHVDDQEVRLVIVVPGVFVARMMSTDRKSAASDDVDGAAEPAPMAPAATRALSLTGALGRGLAKVPLELSIELGRARVPLAHVLQLRDGEVLELEESTDAPVELVSGDAAVARGDLEVSEQGNLVLHVTGIPGQPTPAAGPRVMADRTGDRRESAAALGDAPGAAGVGIGPGPGSGVSGVLQDSDDLRASGDSVSEASPDFTAGVAAPGEADAVEGAAGASGGAASADAPAAGAAGEPSPTDPDAPAASHHTAASAAEASDPSDEPLAEA